MMFERRAGRACPAQVRKGGPQARNDTEQSTPARTGAIAQAVERRRSNTTATGSYEPKAAIARKPRHTQIGRRHAKAPRGQADEGAGTGLTDVAHFMG
jgi:hypothetical protein